MKKKGALSEKSEEEDSDDAEAMAAITAETTAESAGRRLAMAVMRAQKNRKKGRRGVGDIDGSYKAHSPRRRIILEGGSSDGTEQNVSQVSSHRVGSVSGSNAPVIS